MLLSSKHLLSCYFYSKISNYKCLHGQTFFYCRKKNTFFEVCTYAYYELILLLVKRKFRTRPWRRNFTSNKWGCQTCTALADQRWGGTNISTAKHQVPLVSTQNKQPSKPSVEKRDFTEDTQHHTGTPSGALGDHLVALGDHRQCSAAAPLSAHELLQAEGGGRTLQATLPFTLCSYSTLVTLCTVI